MQININTYVSIIKQKHSLRIKLTTKNSNVQYNEFYVWMYLKCDYLLPIAEYKWKLPIFNKCKNKKESSIPN